MVKEKTKVVKDSTERWLLTYSDLMNLLLILFIILYAMSQTDAAKFDKLAASLREAFGENPPASIMTPGGGGNSLLQFDSTAPAPVVPSRLEEQQMQAVKETVSKLIEQENLKGEVEVAMQERGVEISIKERVLFKSGSAEIEEAAKQTIEGIGKVLLAVPGNHIRVEGHTDNDPINTVQFPSNWELSSARATNVLRLLVEKSGINPKIISAVGYGEFTPKVPNTTPENKAANRRVDIVILKSIYDKSEASSEKEPSTEPGTGAGASQTPAGKSQ
ncbi:MAG: flagellar motor protein MotB [Clostridiales bacterium]|jgi:chemotaxis protein MotB|nr:flagellar motor protein MotB [Eubacteriales bacterium]MDH7566315.1 flagellar motor protein MotB [Clostridiales bacterium]